MAPLQRPSGPFDPLAAPSDLPPQLPDPQQEPPSQTTASSESHVTSSNTSCDLSPSKRIAASAASTARAIAATITTSPSPRTPLQLPPPPTQLRSYPVLLGDRDDPRASKPTPTTRDSTTPIPSTATSTTTSTPTSGASVLADSAHTSVSSFDGYGESRPHPAHTQERPAGSRNGTASTEGDAAPPSNPPPSSMSHPPQPPGPPRQQQHPMAYPQSTAYPPPAMHPGAQYVYAPPNQGPPPDMYRGSPNGMPPNHALSLPSMRSLDPLQHQQQAGMMPSHMPPGAGPVGYYGMPSYGMPHGLSPYALPMADPRIAAGRHKKEIKRRTKTGCLTCRKRRIKCDETHPTCNNCKKSKRDCAGYDPIFKQQPQGPTAIQPAPGSHPDGSSASISPVQTVSSGPPATTAAGPVLYGSQPPTSYAGP